MDSIGHVFGAGADLAWWQECARAVAVFVYGFVLLRVLGRRIFGQWAALDIIVSVIIGSNLSRALTGNSALIGTLAATTLLVVLHWFLVHAAARSARLSRFLEGTAIELARNGSRHPFTLSRRGISETALSEALRQSGVERLGDTQLVVLEPSGKITVLKAS